MEVTRAAAPAARPAWRVFYTKPNAERRAADRLTAAGHEVLVPVRTVERAWSDRVKRLDEPLFRGYLFAHVAERGRLAVLEDEGVVRTVGFGGRLAALTEAEVAHLRALAAVPERIEAVMLARFPVGQEVEVVEGPLMGVRGRVVQHRRAPVLLVALPSISHAVRVHVTVDVLRPVTPFAAPARA